MISEAARVEDNARRAAGFALGVAQQVEKRLEEAKKEAHEEAERKGRPFFGGRWGT